MNGWAKAESMKKNFAGGFHWYFPKRASLIVDLLSERERAQALVIAKSGKMDELAKSDMTKEELAMLISNLKKLPGIIGLLSETIDDTTYANSEEGAYGEEFVYKGTTLQEYSEVAMTRYAI